MDACAYMCESIAASFPLDVTASETSLQYLSVLLQEASSHVAFAISLSTCAAGLSLLPSSPAF